MISRRTLFGACAATVAVRPPRGPIVISTWSFGREANAGAWKILGAGGAALDAVEKGINQAELDPENTSVGLGGLPNEEGQVTLDAVIMDGPTHRAGAVGAIEEIAVPISVARKVMEKTRHTFLVGRAATDFAVKMGFEKRALETEKCLKIWEAWKRDPKHADFWTHDTISMLAIDGQGRISAGTSTSGLGFKVRGRVGDSPIVGSGCYVDQDVGAAGATGNGDWMMRFCPSYQAVEFMRSGLAPAAACEAALRRITRKAAKVDGALIAVNREGEVGAARIGWEARGFEFAVRSGDVDEVRKL